jgi:hypothetical protein
MRLDDREGYRLAGGSVGDRPQLQRQALVDRARRDAGRIETLYPRQGDPDVVLADRDPAFALGFQRVAGDIDKAFQVFPKVAGRIETIDDQPAQLGVQRFEP